MTRDDDRPDIDQATEEAEESRRLAEEEQARARESARRSLSLAAHLRRLREANHFGELLMDALRGSRE